MGTGDFLWKTDQYSPVPLAIGSFQRRKTIMTALFISSLLVGNIVCGSDNNKTQNPRSANTKTEIISTTQNTDNAATATGTATKTDTDTHTGFSPSKNPSALAPIPPAATAIYTVLNHCTQHGDFNADCVFSIHCYYSLDDGFQCETNSDWDSNQECAPGSTCIKF